MWNNYHDYYVDSKNGVIMFGNLSALGRPRKVFAVNEDVIKFLLTHRNYRIEGLYGDFVKFRFGFAADACSYLGSWAEVLKDIKGLYEAEKEAGNI